MEGDVVYSGIPKMLYPGMPVSYDPQAANLAHAWHFNPNCIGLNYQHVLPFHLPPMNQHPPSPFYFLPFPPPAAAPSSSLTQALVEQYAPMAKRQLSFDSTDAPAEENWQQQQQRERERQHPLRSSVLPSPPHASLPPPPPSAAMFPQWATPTLSPATVATLMGPADGMSTTELDKMPTFFLGQVLDDNKNSHGKELNQIAASLPVIYKGCPQMDEEQQQQKDQEEQEDVNEHQRNASCDTFFSEASPLQVAKCGVTHVQKCPSGAFFLESPFMPLAGNILNIDHSGRHLSNEREEKNLTGSAGSGYGEMDCDLLDEMDLEVLFQHFKDNEDGISEGVECGEKTAAAVVNKEEALVGAGKKEHVPSAQDNEKKQFEIDINPKDYVQNFELQDLFQSFIEDVDALPPLDLASIGKNTTIAAPSFKETITNATGGPIMRAPRAVYQPYPKYNSAVHSTRITAATATANRKRSSSDALLSFDPHTPEKKSFYGRAVGGLGLGQSRQERRRVLERKAPSSNAAQAAGAVGVRRQRFQVQPFAAAGPNSEITAMLPTVQHRLSFDKILNREEDEDEEGSTDDDDNAGSASPPPSPPACTPTRCVYLFGKTITASDAGRLSRIVLPRAAVEQFLPRCDNKNGVSVTLWHINGTSFDVMLKYWMNGRPVAKRMWLLDQCQQLISGLKLAPGKQLEFFKAPDGRLVVRAR